MYAHTSCILDSSMSRNRNHTTRPSGQRSSYGGSNNINTNEMYEFRQFLCFMIKPRHPLSRELVVVSCTNEIHSQTKPVSDSIHL